MTNPLDHVEQLGAWLRDTDIALLELRGPPGTLRLSSDGTSVRVVDADEPSAAAAPTIAVRALSPGVFLEHQRRSRRSALMFAPASLWASCRSGLC